MKTFIISAFVLIGSLANAQTEKEAYKLFIKSENRKSLNIQKKEFSSIYTYAKCLSKEYNIKLSNMPIFQIKKTDEFLDSGQFRQSLYGLGDTIFPEYHDNGKKTITCNAFATSK